MVNWSGVNGTLRLKFDSLGRIKGIFWNATMSPKAASAFVREAIKSLGKPHTGDKLPITKRRNYDWDWDRDRSMSYSFSSKSFGRLIYIEGPLGNGNLHDYLNDINANRK